MDTEATHILHTVSTACAVGFLFILPARLWKLRKSSIRNAPGKQGLFKAVGIPLADSEFFPNTSNGLRLLAYC